MFGYNPVELYFFTNIVYTIIMFIFLHNVIADKILNKHKDLTTEEIQVTMNCFYIASAFVGSFRLFKDICNFIFDRNKCIWLYRVYNKK